MGSKAKNVLVSAAISLIIFTATTIITVVWVSEQESKPIQVSTIPTDDSWISSSPSSPEPIPGDSLSTVTTESTLPKGCPWWLVPPSWFGDGICHAVFNSAECNFDNGDCDNEVEELTPPPPDCNDHVFLFRLGEYNCDTLLNISECNFDNGDCLPPTYLFPSGCNPPEYIPFGWLGDDVCDSDLNNEECNFDDGDCVADPKPDPDDYNYFWFLQMLEKPDFTPYFDNF